MPVIGKTISAGVPGAISRQGVTIVESAYINSEKKPEAYGVPIKIINGKIEKWETGNVKSPDLYGVLGRTAPGTPGSVTGNDGFGEGVPNTEQPQNVIVFGYVSVICAQGTPVRGGDVFIRYKAASGKNIGDWEATADAGNNVKIAGATWAIDGLDESKVTELRIELEH